ncbi:Nitrate/nitrite response regulator protein NarL [hydrothermal vent metagenome]|uniref:Nitrate/nitrite response regulator protein NarL n=1 Tax=hydrothermal vent metagenome TaxID=652676 RepID=A0A3B1C537_9ZZZZ
MNEQTTNSILIIDDHPLLRRGINDLVSMDDSFQVIAEASNGTEGLELARSLNPDIILLDLNMEIMDGLQTLIALKAAELDSRVVILTVSDNEKDVVATLRAGADGYLLKDMEPEDMLARLHQVVNGQIILSDKVSQLVVRGLHEESRESVNLTNREEEILALIAKGMSNKLIARELDIVESTVKVHVKHLLRKLKLRNRLEAAIWVIEQNK